MVSKKTCVAADKTDLGVRLAIMVCGHWRRFFLVDQSVAKYIVFFLSLGVRIMSKIMYAWRA